MPEAQCLCVGEVPAPQLAMMAAPAVGGRAVLVATLATPRECAARYPGRVWGVALPRALGAAHVASAAMLSFARGLNDTPKIVALLLAVQALDIRFGMLAIAAAMAAGGLLGARKVARTMSHRISAMGSTIGEGQAFTANLVTAMLVIGASRFGLPVSTTHVSVGAIGGLGLASRSLDTAVLRNVVLSWVVTLPLAACLAAAAWLVAQSL